jgi:predicted ATPase
MNDWLATGTEVGKPYFLALLADAELRMGRCADGLRRLDEGLSIPEKLSDSFYEVELHRLKGELMLHSGANRCNNVELEAEAAKSSELRAAMSLVRLLQKQNRREEARAVLAPIYEWFTEGLDTRDLSETQALLEILQWLVRRCARPGRS